MRTTEPKKIQLETAVAEGNGRRGPKAERRSHGAIRYQDPGAPTGEARAKDASKLPVERPRRRNRAEPVTVGRVREQQAGRTERLRLTQRRDLEGHVCRQADALRIPARDGNDFGIPVAARESDARDRSGRREKRRLVRRLGLGPHGVPRRRERREARKPLEGERATQAGRQSHALGRRLEHESPRATHGIEHRLPWPPLAQSENGRGERLAQRRRPTFFAPAASVQALARGVHADREGVPLASHDQKLLGFVGRGGHGDVPPEPIGNAEPQLLRQGARVVEATSRHADVRPQLALAVEMALPGQPSDPAPEGREGLGLEVLAQPHEHTRGEPAVKVGSERRRPRAIPRDAADRRARDDVEASELVGQELFVTRRYHGEERR